VVHTTEVRTTFPSDAAIKTNASITVSRVSKTFHPLQLRFKSLTPITKQPAVHALRDVSLTVCPGRVLGVLGTNGAGKTTLIKMLATLVLPTTGDITVGGYHSEREAGQVRRLIGLVAPDERSFYWRITGRQNLEFFAAFYGLSPKHARMRITELETRLGLEALDRWYGMYSTGMRHRLAIARGMLHEPQILLLDEPTRSLDPLAAVCLQSLIRDQLVRVEGRTVIIATHNLHEAEAICDDVVVLHQGRVVMAGSVRELQSASGSAVRRLQDTFARLACAEGSDG
jgi:ABC-2 type transport system ATP-binding protein